jgi:predicted transcriptional regulator
MKAVMISINPRWCELIANGKKTVEVRKTKPKLDTPFKVYIYCTKAREPLLDDLYRLPNGDIKYGYSGELMCYGVGEYGKNNFLNGKVIGQFICRNIDFLSEKDLFSGMDELSMSIIEESSCVDIDELLKYKGKKDIIYGWHISDLKIYDEPKELSEFFKACDKPKGTDCSVCVDRRENRCKAITRPPQSWCYVEEM